MSKKIMKRSLALGALMAFVITGSAMAAELEDKIAEGVSTPISTGQYDKIIGGKYLKKDTTVGNVIALQSTDVTISSGSAEEVLGGNRLNQVLDTKSVINTTNLTISGGTFGSDPSGTDNVPSALIIGGDNLKINDTDWQNKDSNGNTIAGSGFTVESSIETTNLTINGGEFNSLIVGGSSAIKFYGDGDDDGEYVKSTVNTANLTVTGGTFKNHIIAAGGLADSWGAGASSSVETANLGIEDSTIGVDVYTGGVAERNGVVQVNKANATIKNSTVQDVYGYNATASQVSGDGSAWEYEVNKNAAVNTDLTLENVTADIVDIQKGTIVLKGNNKVETINAGADATVDVSGNTNVGTLKVDKQAVNFNGDGTLDIAKSETKNMNYTADNGVDATVKYNNSDTNTNIIIQDDVLTLEGVKLELTSNCDKNWYHGIIKNSNIESDSEVTIKQTGFDNALGYLSQDSIKAEKITIISENGHAVYSSYDTDKHVLEAKEIVISSTYSETTRKDDKAAYGIYAEKGTTEVKGFDKLTITTENTSSDNTEGSPAVSTRTGAKIVLDGNENSMTTISSEGRGAVVAFGGNITIDTGILEASTSNLAGGTEVRKNSTIGAQGAGSEVNITATGKVILNAEETTNAIGADAGAAVTVDAAGDVDVNGQIEGGGTSGGKRANITVAGNNISIDTVGEDAIRGFLSNIALTAQNDINITSQDKDAIQSVVSKVELNAKTVTLKAGYDGWGINATGDAGNDITVNAENINVFGELGGIQNLAKSTIVVKTDNIMIDAGEKEALRAVNTGVIEVNADKSATVTGDITAATGGNVTINFEGATSFLDGAVTTDDTSKTTLTFNNGATWNVASASRVSTFNSNQGKIAFENDAHVDIDAGSGSLILTEAGKTADNLNTVNQLNTVAQRLGVSIDAKETITAKVVMVEGDVKGETTGVVTYEAEADNDGYYHGLVKEDTVTEKVNTKNQAIGEAGIALKLHWRSHMNDMNKRMGELRNANGEHGVWTRMVRGESEYEGTKAQYNQYQLGYDEKLSVDKRWTVGAAVTFAEGDASYGNGSTDDKSTAFAIYGSKLNNDGTFVDLIARYARIESDYEDMSSGKGDYSTNGMSVSAEFGKRIQQGNGLWIEPQVEFTYGTVDSAEFQLGGKKVLVGDMDSLIGRVGFSLGKDIKQGNVYARASYLYDFDGETENAFSAADVTRTIEEDLGGGWWEVGVGANINLSKATYIYADVEKTFGGEVDTNWQWNLGVRYSF